ncbi:unnamed protein product [Orchesella dallaii]|uniref:Uncharacterized protein n=1 Tax=Orchesella dallaii TaxID=48710 RepID=A0ABP1QGA5_9HEXA
MEPKHERSEKNQALNNTWTSNPGSYQQSTYATQGAEGYLRSVSTRNTGAVAPPPNYGNGNTTLATSTVGGNMAVVPSVPHHQFWETADEIRARTIISNSSNGIMQMLRQKEMEIANQSKLMQQHFSTSEELKKKNRELYENLQGSKSNLACTNMHLNNAQGEIKNLKHSYDHHITVINNLTGENQKLTTERDELSIVATTNSGEITDLKAKLNEIEDKLNDAEARNAGLVEKDNDNMVALGKLKAEKENIELGLKAADEENNNLKSSHDEIANKYETFKSLVEETRSTYTAFKQSAEKLFENLSPNPELNNISFEYGGNDSELFSVPSPLENRNSGEKTTGNKRPFDSDDEPGDLVIDESPSKRKSDEGSWTQF